MISPATLDELPERASVATSMAREMAQAHRQAIEFHRDQLKMSPKEALARVGTDGDQRRILLPAASVFGDERVLGVGAKAFRD